MYIQKVPPSQPDRSIKIIPNNPQITSERELENLTERAQNLANIFRAIGIDLTEK